MNARLGVVAFAVAVAVTLQAQRDAGAVPDDGGAGSRPCEEDAARLVERVRTAIDPYRDPAAARRDGYRPLGHDFPGMGAHWVNPRYAVQSEFDPDRPAILLYAQREGEPVLAGAAFVAILDPGAGPPGPAYLAHAWHEHSGALEEELFAADHSAVAPPDRFRVMVLHVWTHGPVAGGRFDVQNWALPFVREGIEPVREAALARAASLAASAPYYTAVFRHAGVPAADVAALQTRVDDAALASAELLRRARGGRLDGATARALRNNWTSLSTDVGARWPSAAHALRRLERDLPVSLECE